ncbi:hypothetical protein GW7_11805, partial [Heterocephalus glaber]
YYLFFFSVVTHGLTKSLNCPGWAQTCDPPASASHSAGITGLHHHSWLAGMIILFFFFFAMKSHSAAQAGPELLGSSYLPTSTSQVPGTTGARHCAQLQILILNVV